MELTDTEKMIWAAVYVTDGAYRGSIFRACDVIVNLREEAEKFLEGNQIIDGPSEVLAWQLLCQMVQTEKE